MGVAYSERLAETVITHGICEKCASKIFGKLGLDLNAFLDSMGVPVVVVDATVRVKAANRQARAFLQKEFSDIGEYMGGDAFECVHSKLPEGCGNTIHCSGCAIRKAVTDTFQTGKSHLKVPAILNREMASDCRKVALLISTEKVADVVVLRIDEVGDGDKCKQAGGYDHV